MDIQTNHRIKLLNAKCEYIGAVDTLAKKLDYGDNIDCCTEKLFLASKLINRLENHCFSDPTLNTVTVGSEYINFEIEYSPPAGIYNLYSRNTIIATYTSIGGTLNTITQSLLNSVGLTYTILNYGEGFRRITVNTKCSLNVLSIKQEATFLFTVVSTPVCTTTYSICDNCTEDSKLDEMYAVLDNLLS